MAHTLNDPSVIFRTPNGKVLRCACCERLEVAFGNIAVADDPPLFERFRQIVKQLDLDAMESRIDSERPILLPVDGEKVTFRFTREEAVELQELLDGAAAMLELGEMLDETLGAEGDA
jgi:hypothetical protein